MTYDPQTEAHSGHLDDCPHAIGQPPYCKFCAEMGQEPYKMTGEEVTRLLTTLQDTPDLGHTAAIESAIVKWRYSLGLMSWNLSAAKSWDPEHDSDDAYVYRHAGERHAIVAVRKDVPKGQVERLVVHELLHLVHARLDDVAENGRSVDIMELYQQELEVVLNTLSTALTGKAWEPSGVWAKRFEAPGSDEE